jgi:MFS family permease
MVGMSKNAQMLILALSNILFMAGYLALKITLSLYFSDRGMPLAESYAIATGSSALFAVNCIVFSALSRRYFSHRLLLAWGLLLNALAFVCFLSSHLNLQVLGVALWVVGSGMYVVNLNIIINKMFDGDVLRQHANHLRKLAMELGGIIGVLVVAATLYHFGYGLLYIVCGGMTVISLLSLVLSFSNLYHEPALSSSHWSWLSSTSALRLAYSSPVITLLLTYYLLLEEQMTRYLLTVIFLLLYVGIVVAAVRARKPHYLSFLWLITLCSLIYWLSVTTLYNQFNVFLVHDVTDHIWGWHIPPLILLVFDSLSGLIFGAMITAYYVRRPIHTANKLMLGILLIAMAYIILVVGLLLRSHGELLNIGWATGMIVLMAVAMFLISPTLVAQVNQLIAKHEPQEFFTGMLQMVSAFIIVLAYYFFKMVIPVHGMDDIDSACRLGVNLYGGIAVAALLSAGLFYWLRKVNIIRL